MLDYSLARRLCPQTVQQNTLDKTLKVTSNQKLLHCAYYKLEICFPGPEEP